jgi:outer membrane protein W
MKKLIVFLFALSIGNLFASDSFLDQCAVELRVGYFYPSSKLLRQIYRSGGVEGELEVSKTFENNWQVWANAGYFGRSGHSRGLHHRTTLQIIPLSMGTKYVFLPCSRFRPYIGIGPSYTFVNIRNHSRYVKKHSNKQGAGFVVKSGAYYQLTRRFVLDVFFDYYFQRAHFHSARSCRGHNLGGLRTGIGIAYTF